MIAILWRYRVQPEHRAAFEAAYGSDGDWARLFRRHEHYFSTELLREACSPAEAGAQSKQKTQTYLTIDRWRSAADFADFMSANRTDYEALDAATEGWTKQEVKLGVWEDLGGPPDLIGAK